MEKLAYRVPEGSSVRVHWGSFEVEFQQIAVFPKLLKGFCRVIGLQRRRSWVLK